MPGSPHEDGEHWLQILGSAWDQTTEHWHDDLARHFDREHWAPLLAESRGYLDALHQLMELLGDAERDTR